MEWKKNKRWMIAFYAMKFLPYVYLCRCPLQSLFNFNACEHEHLKTGGKYRVLRKNDHIVKK